MIKVIKRDGREKGFEFDRIETAVNNAYLEVYGDKVESFVHEIGDILNMILALVNVQHSNHLVLYQIFFLFQCIFFLLTIVFIKEDLPTLDLPTKTI